jgi:tetrapyrrole methylase family protein/MazG family protein
MTSAAKIIVVGLGPGDPSLVTAQTLDAIARTPVRFLRTKQHPSASLVLDAPGGATTFDDLYETESTFDEVYAKITERLVDAARQHGQILYAVPGSPAVLERSVQLLRNHRSEIDVTMLPAISFLDATWAALGIDPVDAGVRLVDGHRFAEEAAGERGPLLVAHTHANWVMSDVKLAAENEPSDTRVTILHHLGLPDERIVETTWSEIDRTLEADHLTSLWIPELAAPVAGELVRCHQLARTLREQCPWDREQTHQSLVRYLIEETYEVVDALQALDPDDPSTDDALIEELGDLLYQVEFHSTIAEQEGRFTIADVARTVHDKLVSRHPHVFGDVTAETAEAVTTNWEAIKRAEKPERVRVFDGVVKSAPSLVYSQQLQKKAAKVGFDWPDSNGPLDKIDEEAAELRAAIAEGDPDAVGMELGDLLFSVVNVARHLSLDAESALRAAASKFRERFERVETLAQQRGIDMATAGLTQLDELWDVAKADEPKGPNPNSAD